MHQVDEVIREFDHEGIIKKSICNAVAKNMTKELALETLSKDLQVRLYDYIWHCDSLDIDDGNNVAVDFKDEIKRILLEYFVHL